MTKKFLPSLLIALVCLLVVSCGKKAVYYPAPSASTAVAVQGSKVKQKLYNSYRKWKGTPYRYGGLSREGIDCSGFMYLTFRSQFSHELPRTTRKQAQIGREIQRHQLKAGDLVFFKTGWFDRHVGVYLENNRFLHASTSRGVMISRLDNSYWSDAFHLAKRLPLKVH